jgi:twitching motility protein PilI
VAKTSNLREFQEAILLRLKDVAAQGDVVSTSRLGVTVGSKKLLINLNDVTEVIPVPSVQSVPLTQPWFLGVANIRGNLYNLTDFAQFIKLPATQKSANNRILLLSSDVTTQSALLISSLIGLRNIDVMKVKSMSSEDETSFSKLAYEDAEGNDWFELDVEALVRDKDFIQPTLA